MSKAIFKRAHIYANTLTVELVINGKAIELHDIPVSNEIIKELTTLFKRHLPKLEEIS
jgi:hypothetical protein